MKRVSVLEEPLKQKAVKVYPTETAALCVYLEQHNQNFSDFVRKMVKLELKKYKRMEKQ
jgi:hypothetical protein